MIHGTLKAVNIIAGVLIKILTGLLSGGIDGCAVRTFELILYVLTTFLLLAQKKSSKRKGSRLRKRHVF